MPRKSGGKIREIVGFCLCMSQRFFSGIIVLIFSHQILERYMSNVRHPSCAIRDLAQNAKKRLSKPDGTYFPSGLEPPSTLTPSQREIFVKIRALYDAGEEVNNPIQQLADKEYMETLSHEGKQRYILNLCNDYVEMKRLFLARLSASPTGTKRVSNLAP